MEPRPAYTSSKESNWTKKRDALYEQIDRKVAIIKDLKNFILKVANHDSEQLHKIFNEKKQQIHNIFSTNILEQYTEYKILNKKHAFLIDELTKFEENYDEDDYSFYENNDYIKLSEKASDMVELINQIRDNTDVLFLLRLDTFFDTLIKKKNQVEYYKRRYEDEGLDAFDFEGDANTIEVFFSGYSINVIFESTEYEKKFGHTTGGKHFPFTIFNVIKDNSSKDDIIQHEQNHNITESFSGEPFYADNLIDHIQEQITFINKLSNDDVPDFIIDSSKKQLQNTVKNYTYYNYAEILADIDSLKHGKIYTFASNFLKTSDTIRDLITKTDDIELKNLLQNSWADAEKQFETYIKKLSNVLFVGKKTDHLNDITSAIILFKPNDIQNIEKYTKYKVGAENFEFYSALHPLLEDGNYLEIFNTHFETPSDTILNAIFGEKPLDTYTLGSERLYKKIQRQSEPKSFLNHQTINKLAQLVQNEKFVITLSTNDKEILKEQFFNFDSNLIDFTSDTIDNTLLLINNFALISKKLDVPEILNYALNSTSYQALDTAIQTDNFDNLALLYKKSPILQDALRTIILQHASEGWIFEDYKLSDDIQHTQKTLQNSNFWSFLKQIQLDEEVSDVLNK